MEKQRLTIGGPDGAGAGGQHGFPPESLHFENVGLKRFFPYICYVTKWCGDICTALNDLHIAWFTLERNGKWKTSAF